MAGLALIGETPEAWAQNQVQNTATIQLTGGMTDPTPGNNTSTVVTAVYAATIAKSANPSAGTIVGASQIIGYTLIATVTGAATTQATVFTDTLSSGLTLVPGSLPAQCSAAGQVITCTLPAGAAIGTHSFQYQATVDMAATGSVSNSVTGGNGCTSGQVCTTSHPVQTPQLTLIKRVTNDNGGTATVTDFGIVTSAGALIFGANTGTATNAVYTSNTLTVPAGTYSLSESDVAGYAEGTWTCSGSGVTGGGAFNAGSITLVTGAVATCEITNDDQAATLTLVKQVSGGPGTPADWTLTATGPTTISGPSGTAAVTDVAVAAGDYTLAESGGPAGATYSFGGLSCTGFGTIPLTTPISLSNGESTVCTFVNNHQPPDINLSKSVANAQFSVDYDAAAGPYGTYTVTYDVTAANDGTGVGTYSFTDTPVAPSGTIVTSVTLAPNASTTTITTSPANGATSASVSNEPLDPSQMEGWTVTVAYQVTDPAALSGATECGAGGFANNIAGDTDTSDNQACVSVPTSTLTLIKRVVNDDGGAATVADFPLTATGPTPGVTGVSGTPSVTNAKVLPGSYTLSEDLAAGYAAGTWTCSASGGNSFAPSAVVEGPTINVGPNASLTCTIINDDQPATLTLVKQVVNDNGGTAVVGDFPLTANGAPFVSGVAQTVSAGTYALAETNLPGYTAGAWSCDAGTLTGSDLVLTNGQSATCTIVNDDQAATLTLIKTVSGGSASATDWTLNATGPTSVGGAGGVNSVAVDAGTYTLAETGGPANVAYIAGTWNCDAGTLTGDQLTLANGVSATCTITNTYVPPAVSYSKSASTAGPVAVGDTIEYTLTTVVANSQTTGVVTLTDTLGTGLTFGSVTNAGAYTCNATNPLVCTLPAGTLPGTYTVTYTATVNDQATGTVTNAVVGTGPDNPGCTTNCGTSTPVVPPIVEVAKSSNPATGSDVRIGQTIEYTLSVTVSNAATSAEVILTDTPDRGLTIGALPNGCTNGGATITCVLPSGTPAGTYTFVYPATVNDQADTRVGNLVIAVGGGGEKPTCDNCETVHELKAPELRISKTAGVREVKIGDLVRYTLVVENVGETDLSGGNIVDTPPAGFSYVEGSLQVADGDNLATVSGQSPLRFNGLDVTAGGSATLVYLMRVGAGVRPGTHINQAQAFSSTDDPISNIATAEVLLIADPLIDDTLVFGTVFDDRDGDGWQDSAALSGLRVQGGFSPSAYVANSTTVDRGAGPQPEPDASSPLLHGIALGEIRARQSDADPVEDHRVIIRQRVNELAFTDDFVLTSAEGVTVRMDAEGMTTVEKHGEAAKGLNAAEPTVERRVSQSEGGYVVDYVISNVGVDERGIPGVRIASVEGLLIETDQYGRYHLAGVPGGAWERGRNFILKVDPSTLPAGAQFTTDNPLLRRITPGIPVRFDWGIKLPVQMIEGGTEQVELELGEVFFAPGSAEVRPPYLPAIEKMAAKVREYRGGEVVIDANGTTETLAFDRAMAVKEALTALLDAESAKGLVVSVRGNVDDPDSLLVGVDEGGALLGTVLFDTDKSDIRPEFEPLLDKIATALDRRGGGAIAIVGHTDIRASHKYNVALGMRRAKSVYDALAKRLSPEVRSKVQVEASNDPTAPVDVKRK